MRKMSGSRGGDRLGTSLNARFDVMAPKKEFENSEKQIDRIKKESQKVYEWEMKQLSKKLEGLPGQKTSTGSRSQGGSSRKISGQKTTPPEDTRKTSSESVSNRQDTGAPSGRSRNLSTVSNPPFGKEGSSADPTPGITAPWAMQGQVAAPTDKQSEALRQLKFLYETAVALVADAEATGAASNRLAMKAVPSKSDDLPGTEEAVVQKEEKRKTSQKQKGPRNFAALKADLEQGPATPTPPPAAQEEKVVEEPPSRKTSRSGRPPALAGPPLEYQGIPSQAVQLISMIRVLMMGSALNAKQMKGLTAVIEESRVAVKAVKGNQDPDRAQEKLNRRLNELMDLVKPTGADMTLTADQLLRCSYLRLTRENVERLENMLKDQGIDPGIHSHSDVSGLPLFERAKISTNENSLLKPMAGASQEQNKLFQPTSVFMTKAGVPMSKKRTAKPDSIVGQSEEEENLARMKKFRVT